MEINEHVLEKWYKSYYTNSVLNISEYSVDAFSIRELIQRFSISNNKLKECRLNYALEKELNELKKRLAIKFNSSPDNVLITNGASEALYIIITLMCKDRCNIIIQKPFFYNYQRIIENTNTEYRSWNVLYKNPSDEIKQLREIINPKTRLVLISNPNNPCGRLYSNKQLSRISTICEEQQAILAVDEVGLPALSEGFLVNSISSISPSKSISIGSFSKLFGVPGIRVGWLIADTETISQCEKYKDVLSISNSELSLIIANQMLENIGNYLPAAISAVYRNIDIVAKWISENDKFHWEKPKFSLSALIMYDDQYSSQEFCHHLLKRSNVFIVPGSCFCIEKSFRISLGCDTEKLKKGLWLISSMYK
jgi:aspartate/methionine/tyrosine aminotransferase